MRQILRSFLSIAAVFTFPGLAAAAQEPPSHPNSAPIPTAAHCGASRGSQGLTCLAESLNPVGAGLVKPAVETAATKVSTARFVPYERIVSGGGASGEDCLTTAYREVPENIDPSIGSALSDRMFGNILASYPDCPADPESPAATETPQTYAARYWQDIPLPHPQPHIAPGRAITGMFAYLETRGTTTHTFTEPNTPFGPLTITATGRYYVDWGDGTRTGPHSKEGGPWPDGSIKHEYLRVGEYDVVVTERWTATWNFGSESGTLDELRTVGRIEDFPVQQIQAVVLR